MKLTFLLNNERIHTLARKALAHMTAEERARAEVPILGATEGEIRLLARAAREGAEKCAAAFAGLETYCMFIGYPRSGHSLVGSLLDAHSQVVIAHEMNVLKFIDVAEFTAPELYWLILENSRLFAMCGRRWGDYSYGVPGMFQGSFQALKVIGDKKGAGSTQLLARKPELLDRLQQIVPLPLRVVHIARNPYDNIATVARKDTGHVGQAVNFYASLCRANQAIMERLGKEAVLQLRHEDVIRDPKAALKSLSRFLGVPADEHYLSACAAVVSESASRSRDKAKWEPQHRDAIEKMIAEYPFLEGYSFDK